MVRPQRYKSLILIKKAYDFTSTDTLKFFSHNIGEVSQNISKNIKPSNMGFQPSECHI